MSDPTLTRLIDDLHAIAPIENAFVTVDGDERENDWTLTANRAGFLRLGLELLRAADAPADADSGELDLDLDYLLAGGSSAAGSLSLVRTEDPAALRSPPPPPAPTTLRDRMIGVAGGLIGVVLLVSLMVGIGTIVEWLAGRVSGP